MEILPEAEGTVSSTSVAPPSLDPQTLMPKVSACAARESAGKRGISADTVEGLTLVLPDEARCGRRGVCGVTGASRPSEDPPLPAHIIPCSLQDEMTLCFNPQPTTLFSE